MANTRPSQASKFLRSCHKWVYVEKLHSKPLNPTPCPLGVSLERATSFSLSPRILEIKGTSGLQAQSPTQLVQKPLPHALYDISHLFLLVVFAVRHHCVLRSLGSYLSYTKPQ